MGIVNLRGEPSVNPGVGGPYEDTDVCADSTIGERNLRRGGMLLGYAEALAIRH